jgi:transposase
MMITTANITDRDGAIEMIDYYSATTDNLCCVKKVLTDSGYSGENFAYDVSSLINAEVEVVKRNELHTFVVLPKRWIVERSFGWLDKCRRLWKNCERFFLNTFTMLSLAFIRILLLRF